MSLSRRTLLTGTAGLAALGLTACTQPPTPTPTTTVRPLRATAVRRSNWHADPFARGSTSFIPVGGSSAARRALAESIDDRLFFAGEATATTMPNTLEGARSSGVRAAGEVVRAASPADRVAVIGAGIAGASCARVLAAAGLEVLVIEGRNRVGGRIRTERDAAWPTPVELGARSFDATVATILLDEVEASGSASVAIGPAVRRRADGTVVEGDAQIAAVLDQVRSASTAAGFDLPLSSALAALAPLSDEAPAGELSDQEAAAAVIAELAGARAGALPRRLSIDDGLDEVPGAPTVAITDGTDELVLALLGDVELLLSSAVAGIRHGAEGVSIRLATGESVSVDRVVITVPLGVLQSEGIEIEPELPRAHRAAIASLAVGVVETVVLRFDSVEWGVDATVWKPVPSPELLVAQWFNAAALTGEPIIEGRVGPSQAARLASLSDDELITLAMRELGPFVAAGR